ncbi:pyridine nucleotide-disulfide oxidoreductase [Mycolicibacterium mageritense DSM 44476 = CIP 104973]|uniref:Pyridine nucleotide-disulfide oxidoreductase n=2 Tax=Mycolicibacterium mageritense TaxID=53462 RepID=A0AAI8TXG0_MYCME|nr:MAG: pyridine nucleotide-disulfide oxidoreductase [Mycolicibacterium mageritense]BBX35665.1 pyridine nucleotide-disulfide oxidoreductase [Mycolicibacterium mageritense]BDY30563.1 putative pyridine nucleotide-disulfide oxidoreductase RclA [Mycolicibacterium mageritense]CDO19830.1 mercuric reductase [Mycolicibacterium mageritense DSM 44476 = CIP 104973]
MAVDLLVIGFGKGGKTLAAEMGRRGQRVVLVEESAAMYGGTCINTGCVPTKSMVHWSEQQVAAASGASAYAGAVASTERLTAGLRAVNLASLASIPSVTVLTGKARFLDPETVEIHTASGTVVVTASYIVIGTGSTPNIPDLPGLRENPVTVTSAELLRLASRPDQLVVLGGGYIGLEFASMYAGFGSAVTVVEQRPTVLANEDADVANAARALLLERGVAIVTGATVVAVQTIMRPDSPPAARVEYLTEGRSATIDADAVLIALGRAPNTADLGLDLAGIEVTDTGAVVVDDYRRTSQPHIFAVGDVNGGPQFTYVSLDDYRIVLDQLTDAQAPRRASHRDAVPNCLFLTPPLARVGLTETQARTAGYDIRVAASPVVNLATVARARIVGQTAGMMKVVVDAATDRILGTALLCHDAHEIINLVALAMRYGITANALRDEIYTHPSMSECFNQLLGMLN